MVSRAVTATTTALRPGPSGCSSVITPVQRVVWPTATGLVSLHSMVSIDAPSCRQARSITEAIRDMVNMPCAAVSVMPKTWAFSFHGMLVCTGLKSRWASAAWSMTSWVAWCSTGGNSCPSSVGVMQHVGSPHMLA